MSDETTARHQLPLIVPGQAQKEMTHNEALAVVDLLSHPCVAAIGGTVPPASPASGDCWIVGDGATGAWSGQDGAIAGWTVAGWRFAAPRVGMLVWDRESAGFARFAENGWHIGLPLGDSKPLIPMPAGGMIVDEGARDAIAAIIMTLQHFGMVART